VWLPDELVHLRVCCEVDDEIDIGILDTIDPAAEGRVVAGEILEQIPEFVGPRVLALVYTEDVVPFALESQSEVRTDLAG
jgi:hypothetical protein